jgi:hypothetical protein
MALARRSVAALFADQGGRWVAAAVAPGAVVSPRPGQFPDEEQHGHGESDDQRHLHPPWHAGIRATLLALLRITSLQILRRVSHFQSSFLFLSAMSLVSIKGGGVAWDGSEGEHDARSRPGVQLFEEVPRLVFADTTVFDGTLHSCLGVTEADGADLLAETTRLGRAVQPSGLFLGEPTTAHHLVHAPQDLRWCQLSRMAGCI